MVEHLLACWIAVLLLLWWLNRNPRVTRKGSSGGATGPEVLECRVLLASYTATDAASLADAINQSNSTPGRDTIEIRVSVSLSEALPEITDAVNIRGNQHEIAGNGSFPGFVSSADRVLIEHVGLVGFSDGIVFRGGGESSLARSVSVSNSGRGVYLANAPGAAVANSEFSGNRIGVLTWTASHDVAVLDSLFSGNQTGIDVRSSGSAVMRNEVSGGGVGIRLQARSAHSNQLIDNDVSGAVHGVLVRNGASGNRIQGGVIHHNENGVTTIGAFDTVLQRVTLTDNERGVYAISGSGTFIAQSTITNNSRIGVFSLYSDPVRVWETTVDGNRYGIDLRGDGHRIEYSRIDNSTVAGVHVTGRDNWIAWNTFTGGRHAIVFRGAHISDNDAAHNDHFGLSGVFELEI